GGTSGAGQARRPLNSAVRPTKDARMIPMAPITCQCGQFAKAFCVRCHAPLCKRCKQLWEWVYYGKLPGPNDPGMPDMHLKDLWRWAPDEMEKHRVPPKEAMVVCEECESECNKVLDVILRRFIGSPSSTVRPVAHQAAHVDVADGAT